MKFCIDLYLIISLLLMGIGSYYLLFRKQTDKAIQALSVLLIYTFLYETLCQYLTFKYKSNTFWFFIGTPTFISLYTYMFLYTIKKNITIKAHLLIWTVPYLFALLDTKIENYKEVTSYFIALEGFIVIVYALYALYCFMIKEDNIRLYKHLMFWVWSAFLVSNCLNFCFWITYRLLSIKETPLLNNINTISSLITNIVILLALLFCRRRNQ